MKVPFPRAVGACLLIAQLEAISLGSWPSKARRCWARLVCFTFIRPDASDCSEYRVVLREVRWRLSHHFERARSLVCLVTICWGFFRLIFALSQRRLRLERSVALELGALKVSRILYTWPEYSLGRKETRNH
uniref:Secreted protein n=1 Tax=Anopheles triannulatus TaxID=58253 RepID=A0A2M4B644_9DIPT